MDGPLKNLLVVDLTRVLVGPYCTMILSDLGARVIKIEAPEIGDDSRGFGPFIDDYSAYFMSLNRGKESIALNLKNEDDKKIFEKILAKADILVENFKPGTLEKWGFGWNEVSKKYHKLINSEIKLKKRKRIFIEDTRYFVEDIRKKVIQDYGYDKVHKQGFNIKSPINLELQNLASESLRRGLLEYDKRKGWRGPLDNRKNEDWSENLDKFNLEKTIDWDVAIVKRIDKFETVIQTSNKENGVISYEDINWTRKNFNQIFKINDLIYVKKISDGIFSLRQLPNVNGGIVVMDPYSGRV